MGGYTRFDCALGSHSLMRRAFSVALYHAHQRQVMGKTLVEQPLMRQLLCQQALQLEGQTALLMRIAQAWSQPMDEQQRAYARLFTPAAKFEICKNATPFIAQAMETLGGIGYCEESELPRLYREAPVNSIWEGAGNVMCLDVLRVLKKQPAIIDMLAAQFEDVKGLNRHFDSRWRQLRLRLRKPQEAQAREIASQLLLLATGQQLLTTLEPPLADAWCQRCLDTRGALPVADTVGERLLLRASGG